MLLVDKFGKPAYLLERHTAAYRLETLFDVFDDHRMLDSNNLPKGYREARSSLSSIRVEGHP
jgi:hypothetical protein